MKNTLKIAIVAAHFVLVGAAQAASVSLSPSPQNGVVGNTLTFDLNVNFSDVPTLGGGFNVTYDSSRLGFNGFSYAPVPVAVTPVSTVDAGVISGVGFNAFTSVFSGNQTLATLSFTALDTGAYTIGLVETLE
ncbi:MAG: cohesin domain-containing protein, partial [Gammaproteobacteria bacterium]